MNHFTNKTPVLNTNPCWWWVPSSPVCCACRVLTGIYFQGTKSIGLVHSLSWKLLSEVKIQDSLRLHSFVSLPWWFRFRSEFLDSKAFDESVQILTVLAVNGLETLGFWVDPVLRSQLSLLEHLFLNQFWYLYWIDDMFFHKEGETCSGALGRTHWYDLCVN